MKARYVKTHPHALFPEYPGSVFVDGSVLVVADVMPLFDQIGGAFLGVHTHPDHRDMTEEARTVVAVGRAERLPVQRQLDDYRAEGFSEKVAYETKILVRRHGEEGCVRLMERWWGELERHTDRDQLSLPYAVWKEGAAPNVCILGDNPQRNPRFRCFSHSSSAGRYKKSGLYRALIRL